MAGSPRSRFASLYSATLAPLRRYLAGMLGSRDDAEDLAHDAYARVYKALDTQAVRQPEAFLFTTARRLALNQIRRRQIAPVRPSVGDNLIEFTPATTPGVERLVMARNDWALVEAAIAALPPGCRQVLIMGKLEHLSHAEIGAALGISVSTVEKQHARALRLLRAALHDDARPKPNRDEETGDQAAER